MATPQNPNAGPKKGQRETSRGRAGRIPQDYWKKKTGLDRARFLLTLAAALGAVGYWAYGYTKPGGPDTFATHGPVAAVHAAWDHKCEACHESFKPINGNTWLHKPISGGQDPTLPSEAKCVGCHAGPDHHAGLKESMVQTCGHCHRDHQGRDFNLSRVPDADCTTCHADLKAAYEDKNRTPGYANKITGFAADHPKFRPLEKKDPAEFRTIKFSHVQHMWPGQFPAGGRGALTVDELGKQNPALGQADLDRYRRYADDKGRIQLDCAHCHEFDANIRGLDLPRPDWLVRGQLPRNPLFPSRMTGHDPLPVNFDRHCAACHPNSLADGRTTPHRLQPGDLGEWLRRSVTERVLTEKGKDLLDRKPRARVRLDAPETPQEAALKGEIDRLVAADRSLMMGASKCLKCHDTVEEAGTVQIKPVDIPDVWMPHARFSHTAHRAMQCAECHPGMRDDKAGLPVVEKTAVGIKNIESCRECHSPAGGVRHDCTECHTYHNGDHPLQGQGADERGAARFVKDKAAPVPLPQGQRMTVAEFLRGVKEQGAEPAKK